MINTKLHWNAAKEELQFVPFEVPRPFIWLALALLAIAGSLALIDAEDTWGIIVVAGGTGLFILTGLQIRGIVKLSRNSLKLSYYMGSLKLFSNKLAQGNLRGLDINAVKGNAAYDVSLVAICDAGHYPLVTERHISVAEYPYVGEKSEIMILGTEASQHLKVPFLH